MLSNTRNQYNKKIFPTRLRLPIFLVSVFQTATSVTALIPPLIGSERNEWASPGHRENRLPDLCCNTPTDTAAPYTPPKTADLMRAEATHELALIFGSECYSFLE